MSNKAVWDLLGFSKEPELPNTNKMIDTVSIFDLLVWEDSIKLKNNETFNVTGYETHQIAEERQKLTQSQENSEIEETHLPSKFPYAPEINKKIILW
jgi:hypothetical protein